jgi:hypothetical protein
MIRRITTTIAPITIIIIITIINLHLLKKPSDPKP